MSGDKARLPWPQAGPAGDGRDAEGQVGDAQNEG